MSLLPRRLAPRLILGTTLLVVVGCLISTLLSTGELEEQLTAERITAADQLSRSVISATWHAMRAGRKEDAYEVMQAIGDEQGVEWIRMLDRTGGVSFETIAGSEDRLTVDSPTCRVCHATDPPRVDVEPTVRSRFWTTEGGGRRMAIVTPIPNEPGCSTADCHAHDAGVKVLGLLDVALSMDDLDTKLAVLRWKAFVLALVKSAVIAAFIAFFVHRFVGRPIRRLREGARAIANLELETPIRIESASELGELGAAFEDMRKHLWVARSRVERFTEELEEQVEERTAQLKATQEQLIQSDRMASMGQLAASVVHEVNNPISAVLNLSMFLQRILGEDGVPPDRLDAFRRHLGQISDETARAGRIVSDLLAFSRRSSPQRTPTNLNDVVDRAVGLVRHRSELENVKLVVEPDPKLPLVSCDRSQIVQVIVNLVLNALEAIEGAGTVVVRTGVEAETRLAILQVEDDGPGIADDHIGRIFDPFFSTKLGEKGVGLGLAVVYGIIEAHDGRLAVASRVAVGTTFTVRLPLSTPRDPAASRSAEEETA